jgi:cytoskeletal protein CcmA (bactofilin family)
MSFFSSEPKHNKQNYEAVDTIIGEKADLKGSINSSGSVCINGKFEGSINSSEEIILSLGSKVKGEINGGSVVVSGHVEGNITALHNLEITKTGRVNGDLCGGKILIEEGSSYRGRVIVKGEEPDLAEEAGPGPD